MESVPPVTRRHVLWLYAASALLLSLAAGTGPAQGGSPETQGRLDAGPDAQLDTKTAYERRLSQVLVLVEGVIVKLMVDDFQGHRHQRFVIETDQGQSLMIAHDLDSSARVPVRRGDRVRVHGEYLWNLLGGLIHKTHRDPKGKKAGGWIELVGSDERYE